QLHARQGEAQLARSIGLARIAVGLPVTAIPYDDFARAVLPVRYGPFEIVVGDGVVLDVDGHPLYRRVETGPLGHGPALHRALYLQTEVVMEPPGPVLLHDIAGQGGCFAPRGDVIPAIRFRCLREVAHLPVLRQRVGGCGGTRCARLLRRSTRLWPPL